jgi:hypothetical protein
MSSIGLMGPIGPIAKPLTLKTVWVKGVTL